MLLWENSLKKYDISDMIYIMFLSCTKFLIFSKYKNRYGNFRDVFMLSPIYLSLVVWSRFCEMQEALECN